MPTLRAIVAGSLLALVGACAKGKAGSDFTSSPKGTAAPIARERLATSAGRGGFEGEAEAQRFDADARDEVASDSADAPGLGTAFGEERSSAVTGARFERSASTPEAVLALFYDDVSGLRRRAGRSSSFGQLESRVTNPDGTLTVSLVDDRGRVFPAAQVGDRRFALASQGLAYRIGVENHANERFEAVASVDGLDVMDGSEASFAQRGYIVEPFTSMVIEGWRTSEATVAAFRFSELDDSYAERTGRARNIGVVGVAFFREESAQGLRGDRGGVDPFPGRFAPAPPRR